MIHCKFHILLIFIHVLSRVKGEYHIKDKIVPSYLYRKFDDTEEEVFPNDIRIKISLSKISGTLFYSIDRLKNQLILSLNEAMEPILGIEFGTQKYDVSLSQLCGCEWCRYEPLDIRIKMKDVIHLQCNGGTVQTKPYGRTMKFNTNYPIPFTNSDFNMSSTNTAHMWLVNNPVLNDIYPNSEQLSGCIFDVLYNNLPMTFTTVSENVGRICTKTCTTNICNGGQCMETYQKRPVCNCTTTFLNGDYCNDTIYPMNIKSTNQVFQFGLFKLAWNSVANQILTLDNSNLQIRLNRLEKTLMVEYNISTLIGSIAKSILTQSYVPNTQCILIGTFHESFIDIKIFIAGIWYPTMILTNRDMRQEIFSTITLRSDRGIIGMAYKKSPREYTWMNVSIPEYIQLENGRYVNDKKQNNSIIKEKGGQNWIAAIIVPIVILLLIIGLVLFFCIRRRRMRGSPPVVEIFLPEIHENVKPRPDISNPNSENPGKSESSLDESPDPFDNFKSIPVPPEKESSSEEETDQHQERGYDDKATPLIERLDLEPGYVAIGYDTRKEVPLPDPRSQVKHPLDRNRSVKGQKASSSVNTLDGQAGFVSIGEEKGSSSDEGTDPHQGMLSVRGDEFRRDFIKFPK